MLGFGLEMGFGCGLRGAGLRGAVRGVFEELGLLLRLLGGDRAGGGKVPGMDECCPGFGGVFGGGASMR